MTRQWLSLRMTEFDEVAILARTAKSADPDGTWYFMPSQNGIFLEAGFRVTAVARKRLAALAPGPSFPGQAPPDLAVHHASSELALELRTKPLGRLVIRHLAELTAHLERQERAAFLFHYWRECSAGLEPAERVRMGRLADSLANDATTDHVIPTHAVASWHHYLAAVRAAATTNYVLYHHSRLTHDRLGIPLEEQALASRIVRGMCVAERMADAA